MEKYHLNKNDFELLNNLLKISKSIYILYKKLYELEINDKKEETEYKKTIEYLKVAIGVENEAYKKLKLDYEKCDAYINYIINDMLPEDYNYNYESIAKEDFSTITIQRVLIHLIRKITKMDGENNNIFKDILEELNRGSTDEELKIIMQETIEKTMLISDEFEKDFISIYLYYISNVSNVEFLKDFNDNFILSKYNITFINKIYEYKMINRMFEPPKELLMESVLLAKGLEFDMNLFIKLKNCFGEETALVQIDELLDLTDSDFCNRKNNLVSILRQGLLSASLSFLNNEGLDYIEDEYYKILEDDLYLESHKDDTIGKELVHNQIYAYINKANKNNVKKKSK